MSNTIEFFCSACYLAAPYSPLRHSRLPKFGPFQLDRGVYERVLPMLLALLAHKNLVVPCPSRTRARLRLSRARCRIRAFTSCAHARARAHARAHAHSPQKGVANYLKAWLIN
eukprot:401936-Pleurochrysis_carterae.AAC.2